MLMKDQLGSAPKIYFLPELKNCPYGDAVLKRTHTAWNKKISSLNGVVHAWGMAYACPNKDCEYVGVTYVRRTLAEVRAQNGRIILAMDGVQPEKGNETLYISELYCRRKETFPYVDRGSAVLSIKKQTHLIM